MCTYIGGLGELVRFIRPPVTGRSASFRLRFRFVRAVRAGEAKLCVRVRRASSTLGLGSAAKARFRAVWASIVARRKRGFYQLSMNYLGFEA